MRAPLVFTFVALVLAAGAAGIGAATAAPPPLLAEPHAEAIASEISGEAAKRNLEAIVREHRMRGSRGFNAAAEHIAGQLRSYGFEQVELARFPADGKIFYGTQRSRPPWDARFAELWELAEVSGRWTPRVRLASWDTTPLSLAQDSASGEAEADLVDIEAGTSEKDYAGRVVTGALVLTSSQPEAVEKLAIEKYGAAGIVSYAQNQRTAWWGEDENLLRWGHLGSFPDRPAFAFMITLKQARALKDRLAKGERIRLSARVDAGRHDGAYEILTAVLPGADPRYKDEEIVFSCHLDHPRPGANDNASGAAAILEVARTLSKLIAEKRIPPPRRPIRFIWPPEIEGTLAFLEGRPGAASRIKAAIHLDMVGGGPVTKAVFHVTRGPASLPSFINDVAESLALFVNSESLRFASGAPTSWPLNSPEGGKEPLAAVLSPFSEGSDHQVYTEGSYRIPAIYFNDWPDRYIHTNFDTSANIDPTRLKRSAFLAATSGWYLANMTRTDDAAALWPVLAAGALRRSAEIMTRRVGLADEDENALVRFHLDQERAVFLSMSRFIEIPPALSAKAARFYGGIEQMLGGRPLAPAPRGDAARVYTRNPGIRGPMTAFGYGYFEDYHGRTGKPDPRILSYAGARGSGSSYAYEILNFVDGRKSVSGIRDAVSAIYGPVPLNLVAEYLAELERIEVIQSPDPVAAP